MAKDYRKQLTFQAGEVSPLFYGRSDAPYYSRGLAIATNVIVEKRGGIFRRSGLEFIADGVGNDSRVFTKQISVSRFDTMFMSDLLLTIIKPGGVIQTMVTPYTEDQLQDIHLIEEPNGQKFYFTHPNVQVQEVVYDFGTDIYTDMAPVGFTAKPAAWAGVNWPATGTFYQGRLWLGGTPEEPQTFWASVSGSPEDFTVTASSDASSLEFTLQQFGRIKWMFGTRILTIGAENGEHVVTASGPVITPTDFKIEQQSSYGSNNIQAIQVGEKVMYLTPDGRRLQAMAYDEGQNNWLSQDLTFVSEHITKGIAKQKTWVQNPNALLFITMEDGNLAVLTYDRTADTVGWCSHTFIDLNVLDVATGTINGVSKLVVVGQRTVDTIEVTVSSSEDGDIYLDSYGSAHYPLGDGRVVTGLDHIEGQTAQVVADGAVHPPLVVVGGQITINYDATDIYAGIQIKSKIITLPPDVPNGSIRSWKKRWNKVWALVNQSNAPIINGIRPPDRTPATPMNTAEPPVTGHFKTVNLGWDDFGLITIEEDLPVPMNILAIYGEMGRESVG
jgi:hypothetical protein